ncbi:MAG: hypothetical protein JJ975_16090, partial [Bacteroidia bacterium]|nr:hypothetical protein [Bacteroidia bacterium]
MQINSKTLNVGIIGKGNFSDDMIRGFLDKKMFGLCCGLQSHSNYENLLPLRNYEELDRAVDAVLIFDPTFCLYENLVEVIKSCKHIYVADTAHMSNHQLKRLSRYAHEAGVHIQISNGLRFQNIHNDIKDMDLEPRIVECNHYMRRPSNKRKVSLINDLLLPDIDIVLSMTKSRVKHVSATGVGVLYEDPDVVNARVEFYNGCVATISASKIADKEVHKFRFFQNDKYHTLNFQNQSLRVVSGADIPLHMEEIDVEEQMDDTTNYHKIINRQEILEKEIESFYYCIVLGTEPVLGIDEFIASRTV